MGLRENKLLTSEESVLPEKRFLVLADAPSTREGSVQDSIPQFRNPSGSSAEDAGEGRIHEPRLRVILCGLPLWLC